MAQEETEEIFEIVVRSLNDVVQNKDKEEEEGANDGDGEGSDQLVQTRLFVNPAVIV